MAEPLRKKIRIPFYPEDSGRVGDRPLSYNEDARYENCIVDIRQNPITKTQVPYIVKRPGVNVTASMNSTLNATGVDEFETQGIWNFRSVFYFVNNNKLYKKNASPSTEGTLLYTFNASTVFTSAAVKMWEQFGTDFTVDFEYRATEIFNEGLENLYITNGFEDVYIDRDGQVFNAPASYNRFSANSYYKPGDKVISTNTTSPGYYYIVVGEAGISKLAAAEPAWTTTIGATYVSGAVTFMCFAVAAVDDVARIYTNRAYTLNDLVQPAIETGYFYKVTTAGTTLAEPTWTQIKGSTCTNNGVVFECLGYYGGKPGLALPAPVYLDTYLVLSPYKSSDIYNSDPGDSYSWNPTSFISADSFTSPAKAIARYNNYIIMFSDRDAELFYDNANTTGSPFSRHESFLLQIGAVTQNGLVGAESLLSWVGVSSAGTGSIWLLDGFEPKEISTPWINRLLVEDNAGPGGMSSYALRVSGHLLFVYNFATDTLVYDVGMGIWYHWTCYVTDTSQGPFLWDYYAYAFESGVETHYLMSRSLKEVYQINWAFYSDYKGNAGATTLPIRLQIVTPPIDFDNRDRKFLHSLDIIGDLLWDEDTNGWSGAIEDLPAEYYTLGVAWNDFDYQNWRPTILDGGTYAFPTFGVDLRDRPRIAPCGSFRRRAFLFQYTGNFRIRLEAMDLVISQGAH